MTTPMLDGDHEMDRLVRDWIGPDDDRAPDREQQVRRIMGRVEATRQRSRWWPLVPFAGPATRGHHEVLATGAAPVARRPLVRLSAAIAVALLVVGTAALVTITSLAPARDRGVPAEQPIPPADEALITRAMQAWNDDDVPALLGVYASDATRIALYLDGSERDLDAEEVAGTAVRTPDFEIVGDVVRLPDAASGERRYLVITDLVGGTPCLLWIADDVISRHDCILPVASGGEMAALIPGQPPTDVTRAGLRDDIEAAWLGQDRAILDRAYDPDLVHLVAYNDRDVPHTGTDMIWSIIQYADANQAPPKPLIPDLDLPAPAGELRWTDVSVVGGGALCVFWVRDGRVARQDCIVPTRSY